MIIQSAHLQTDPLGFLQGAKDRYGDVFTIRVMAAGRVVALASPELAEQVFTAPDDVVLGGAGQEMMEPVVGSRSIFLSDREDHTWKRRLMLPPFHRSAITRYTEQIRGIAEQEIAGWPVDRPVDLRPFTQRVAMEVIIQTVFGVRDEDRTARLRDRLFLLRKPMNAILMAPPLRRDLGPGSPWRTYKRRREAVNDIIYEEIATRRDGRAVADRFDFLTLLSQARDDDGRAMDDVEIRDQLMSMLFAGYETTALGLAWAIELLSHHPHVLTRLRNSLDDDGGTYLAAVIDETLRLRPPLFHVGRKLAQPMEIGGYKLDAGTTVMIAILLIHQRPDIYEAPAEFRPERFIGQRPPRYGYIPFAAGGRRCLGMHLAKLEMSIVLSHLVRTMDITPVRAEPDDMKLFHITLAPRHGAQVRLHRRAAAPDRAASPVQP